MAFIVGQIMTAQDIQVAGGPYPTEDDTFEDYYSKVATWAAGAGINFHRDSAGYPVYEGGYVEPAAKSSLTPILIIMAFFGTAFLLLRKKR